MLTFLGCCVHDCLSDCWLYWMYSFCSGLKGFGFWIWELVFRFICDVFYVLNCCSLWWCPESFWGLQQLKSHPQFLSHLLSSECAFLPFARLYPTVPGMPCVLCRYCHVATPSAWPAFNPTSGNLMLHWLSPALCVASPSPSLAPEWQHCPITMQSTSWSWSRNPNHPWIHLHKMSCSVRSVKLD